MLQLLPPRLHGAVQVVISCCSLDVVVKMQSHIENRAQQRVFALEQGNIT